MLLLLAYAFLALKRVYVDSWLGTSWRYLVLGCAYVLLFFVASPIINSLMILNA